MADMYRNFIGGEWVGGGDVTRNINPSNTNDVVGHYARRPTRRRSTTRSPRPRAAFPAWARTTPQQRHDVAAKVADEIPARRDELGRLLAREEGKTLAEAIGEVGRAGADLQFLRRRGAADARREVRQRAARRRCRDDARAGRRRRHHLAVEFPDRHPGLEDRAGARPTATAWCSSRPTWCRAARTRWPTSSRAPGFPPASSTSSMGRGSVVGQTMLDHPQRRRHHLYRLGRHRAEASRAPACARMGKFQLEMGGKNPLVVLDDADLKTAVECAVNGAFFSDRPALHRVVAPHRHRGHPRPLRRRARRADEGLVVDDARQAGHPRRPGGRPEPARPGPAYVDIGKDEGAKLVLGGERLNRDTPGFYMAPALFTDADNTMRIAREEIFGPVAAVIRGAGLRRGARGRQRHRLRPVRRHLHHQPEARQRTSSATPRPAWSWSTCPPRASTITSPSAAAKARAYGPREQGRYAAEFYTTVKTAYTMA